MMRTRAARGGLQAAGAAAWSSVEAALQRLLFGGPHWPQLALAAECGGAAQPQHAAMALMIRVIMTIMIMLLLLLLLLIIIIIIIAIIIIMIIIIIVIMMLLS